MGYQQFVASNQKDPLKGLEIREDVLAWILASPEQKANWIDEAKEHKTTDLVLEISGIAKEYSEGVIIALQEKSDFPDAEKRKELYAKIDKKFKNTSREELGKSLKSTDDSIDTYQSVAKKLNNVPLIGRVAKRDLSNLGSIEPGVKVARGMNAVGFNPATSMKTGARTAVGIHKTKEALDDAGSAIKKFGSEHGGKVAIAAGLGAGAIGAAKLLRGRKKKKEE